MNARRLPIGIRLQRERSKLSALLDRLSNVNAIAGADDTDIVARTRAAMHEVDVALRVLRESPQDYGTCARCGRTISDARLDLVPATRVFDAHLV